MIDQNSQFFAILTDVGAAKQANADALGIPWKLTQMGVGDANGTDPIPSAAQTKLINERRRAPLNQLKVDPNNAAVIIAEQVIPENIGGWWIREIGLYDADNDLVAVANCAPSFKPILSQGSGRTQIVRLNLIVSNSANIELKIDPSVVLATRSYVDSQLLEVLPPVREPSTYTKVTINTRGIVISGETPDTLEEYGITNALYVGRVSQQVPVLAASKTMNDYSGSAIQIREAAEAGASQASDNYAPAIGFHWLGRVTGRIFMDAQGILKWNNKALLTDETAYRKPQIDGLLAGKANWAISLAGYGIIDAYTKVEVDEYLQSKADKNKALAVGSVSQQVPVLAASKSINDYSGSGLQIREASEVGASQTSDDYAPALGFHWLGRTTGRLFMNALGVLTWNGSSLLTGTHATQDEVNSGTGNTSVVSAAKLRFGFTFIKGGGGANNAIRFPTWLGGLIIQWGVHLANTADAETNVTFPIAFNIIPGLASTFTHDGVFTQSTVVTQGRGLTTTGFQSRRDDIGTASSFSGTAYIRWIAIGY